MNPAQLLVVLLCSGAVSGAANETTTETAAPVPQPTARPSPGPCPRPPFLPAAPALFQQIVGTWYLVGTSVAPLAEVARCPKANFTYQPETERLQAFVSAIFVSPEELSGNFRNQRSRQPRHSHKHHHHHHDEPRTELRTDSVYAVVNNLGEILIYRPEIVVPIATVRILATDVNNFAVIYACTGNNSTHLGAAGLVTRERLEPIDLTSQVVTIVADAGLPPLGMVPTRCP